LRISLQKRDLRGLRWAPTLGAASSKKWRKDVTEVVAHLTKALRPDDVVLGGGNAKKPKESEGLPFGQQRERISRRVSHVGRLRGEPDTKAEALTNARAIALEVLVILFSAFSRTQSLFFICPNLRCEQHGGLDLPFAPLYFTAVSPPVALRAINHACSPEAPVPAGWRHPVFSKYCLDGADSLIAYRQFERYLLVTPAALDSRDDSTREVSTPTCSWLVFKSPPSGKQFVVHPIPPS